MATGMTTADTDRRLRVGVYDLYWQTLGGGEQVDGSIAQELARDHDVTLLGPQVPDVEATRRRLGVDLSACAGPTGLDDVEAGEASADFDLFVNGTYLSKALLPGACRLLLRPLPRRSADPGRPTAQSAGRRRRQDPVARTPPAAAPHRGPGRVRPPRHAGRVRVDLHPLSRQLAVRPPRGSSGSGATDRRAPPTRAALGPHPVKRRR